MPVTPNSIITPQALKANTVVCTAANADYDDEPANVGAALITAGPNGARVTKVTAIPRGTVSATQLQLYRDMTGDGSAKRLFDSALMSAYTMAQTTVISAETDFGYSDANPLILAPGEKVYPAIGVGLAAGVVFTAEWADY
ncbi:MAG: hypothetical protein ACK4YQ_08285 [Phenylobacterium sp.]|uniref:hypothetical protein n=1 Tax=Phenylobacterium sp. TaxID=1871053 RepID=UPI00391B0927